MRYLSKDDIQKLAEKIRERHKIGSNNPGASLRVSSKGGGVNLGKITTSLSPVQRTSGSVEQKEEAESLPYPQKR